MVDALLLLVLLLHASFSFLCFSQNGRCCGRHASLTVRGITEDDESKTAKKHLGMDKKTFKRSTGSFFLLREMVLQLGKQCDPWAILMLQSPADLDDPVF